jgi:hypothetical protein
MTISTGFRPRSDAERLRMADLLTDAPAVVALGFADDGWAAACLRLAGRTPVWASPGDPAACAAVLARLGLAGLGEGPAGATLGSDLTWMDPPVDTSPVRLGVLVAAADPHRADTSPCIGVASPPVGPASGDLPLVTILVCTFNRAGLLAEAIASARAQTWPCEILVVDDGSTDDTPVVLARTRGIRHVRQEPNQGKPAALARGLAEARGAAILVLDDDDLLLPGAVQVLATALFADPARVAVWGDTVVFDHATGRALFSRPACRLPEALVHRAVLQQIPALPGATLVRTSAWQAAGPRDPSLLRGQDMDLFLSLARLGPIACVPLPVLRYRSHDGLRGAAQDRWRKQDRAVHTARFLSYVKPVFARRYAGVSPITDRADAHAWALGLWQRDLAEAARAELHRWPPPYTPAEAWARQTVGLPAVATVGAGTLVVVDDGDEGALEATLAGLGADAGTEALWVDLEVPRDPLGNVRLYWPGTYGAHARLRSWVSRPGPWRLALTSAPGWGPRLLADPGLLPDLPAPEALSAIAAALGWAAPVRTRPGLVCREGPIARLAWQARKELDSGRPSVAMGPLGILLAQAPGWRGAWHLAAEAFAALGQAEDARTCRIHAAGRTPDALTAAAS